MSAPNGESGQNVFSKRLRTARLFDKNGASYTTGLQSAGGLEAAGKEKRGIGVGFRLPAFVL
jgi:hypothetical protein